MKVECIDIINHITGNHSDKDNWLTVGSIYTVLSIYTEMGDQTFYRIIGDHDHLPGLYNVKQFKVTDELIPKNWVVYTDDGVYMEIGPKSWTSTGFWESYFDGVPEAIKVFETEKDLIYRSVGSD